MGHPKRTELTEPSEAMGAQTAKLPRTVSNIEKSEEDFHLGQSRILQMVAANAPLKDILEQLVLLIEAQSPGMLCSVLLLSDDGDHMRHGAAPSLPEDYVKAVDGEPIGPKHGSCGTAMYRGEPVIVTDIFEDPLWEDYRQLAAASCLRACWSTPILSGKGKVLGSFAMYYRQPRTPTGDEASLTEVATRIAGLAIEHQLARETLARTQAQLAEANQAASTGEAAMSIAQELRCRVNDILEEAKLGIDLLNEDKPEPVRVRETLMKISKSGTDALELISSLRTNTKK